MSMDKNPRNQNRNTATVAARGQAAQARSESPTTGFEEPRSSKQQANQSQMRRTTSQSTTA